MNTDQERADFEAFMSDNGKFPRAIERDTNGNYVLMQAASSWDVWQARAALQSKEREDALRYRWLRQQHWNDNELCVVANPKKAVHPGYDCPSLDRLDEAIDHARRIEENGK